MKQRYNMYINHLLSVSFIIIIILNSTVSTPQSEVEAGDLRSCMFFKNYLIAVF